MEKATIAPQVSRVRCHVSSAGRCVRRARSHGRSTSSLLPSGFGNGSRGLALHLCERVRAAGGEEQMVQEAIAAEDAPRPTIAFPGGGKRNPEHARRSPPREIGTSRIASRER